MTWTITGPLAVQNRANTMSARSTLQAPTLSTPVATGSDVALSWSAVTHATSYIVYRGASPGVLSTITTTTETSYTDSSRPDGIWYYSVVAAESRALGAIYSEQAAVQSVTVNSNPLPGQPTIAVATVDADTLRVSLTAAAQNATTYNVRHRQGAGAYTTITGIAPGSFPYDINSLAADTLYGVSAAGVNVTGTGTYSAEVSAQTSASGGTQHGASVTVTGSGFGTKTAAKPLVFDGFESGTAGNLIAGSAPVDREIGASWVWDDYTSGTYRPRYSAAYARGVSARSAVCHFEGEQGYNCSLEIFKDLPNAGDEVYFSFWYRYERGTSLYSRNHKPWVVYGSNSGTWPEGYVGWGNPDYNDGSLRNSAQDLGATDGTLWASGPGMNVVPGKWRRFEVYLKQCTPGVSDGAWQMWSHDPDAATPVALVMSDLSYKARSGSAYWRQWHIGSYHDNQPATGQPYTLSADVYIDDVYFDTTRARVEIGDNSTFANCTRREVQVATAWSDTSVTFRANKGGFSTGQTCYIFIIDSSGNVQSAGSLTWG